MDQQLGMFADLPENEPEWAIKIMDKICAFEKEQHVNINNLRGKLDDLIRGNVMMEDKLDKALQVAEAAKTQVVTLTKTVDIHSVSRKSITEI